MIFYHAFNDLGIPGVYDIDPIISYYHLPSCKDKNIFDVGSASGYFSRYFVNQGATHVIALDKDVSSLRHIVSLCKLSQVEVLEKSVYDIDYDNEFDIVFCGSLLMHLFYPMWFLRLLYRSLKHGGTIVLATAGIPESGLWIKCFEHVTGNVFDCEPETLSSNESLWWMSESALVNMFKITGFRDIEIKDSFVLKTTDYGISIGQDHSTLHFVVHARK